MNLQELIKQGERMARENSPVILTAFGATGAITTAVLAAKAAYSSFPLIEEYELQGGMPDSNRKVFIERTRLVWRLYVPALASGTVTVICIVAASKASSRRTAAITAAYSISERAFSDYKEKVIEMVGPKKEQTYRDMIAQDRVTNNPPSQAVVFSDGEVLCCELWTGRYFKSDMETLRRAENDINAELVNHDRASLTDFYYLIGLPATSTSGSVGWTSDKLMKLEFSTVLSDDGKPCIAFDYNYAYSV